jgi:hypothetical protein
MKEHPFQPGVIIAVISDFGSNTRITLTAKVDKVYKNGNFTISSDDYKNQQWKPYKWTDRPWKAEKTVTRGENHSRYAPHIRIVDDQLREEIRAQRVKMHLENRARSALNKVRDIDVRAENLTEWQIEALEYFVKLFNGVK